MCGCATTGGIFCTSSFNPVIGTFASQTLSSAVRTCGVPQRNTNALRMIHGVQALRIAPAESRGVRSATGADGSLPGSAGIAVIGFAGCQTLRKRVREAIEAMAAITSTSQGPWKFETTYCG